MLKLLKVNMDGTAGLKHLILGHESLGRVIDPGPSSGLKPGDLVVGIVRRPDPVPCPNCAVGEWDMCRNGLYTERGIKEINGFMSERWRIEPEYAIKVDPTLGILGVLLEPASVNSKGIGTNRNDWPKIILGATYCSDHRRGTYWPSGCTRRKTNGI
jgi:threonine dehydrogenase-like Zn-dependent dehydrogenase